MKNEKFVDEDFIVYLVPVGIDSKVGRQFAPIFEDNRFLFIPLPEFSIHSEQFNDVKRLIFLLNNIQYELRSYSEIPIEPLPKYPERNFMGDYLKDSIYNGHTIRSYVPHFDPEFENFTYGEGSHNKARTLSRLKKNDMIVFYATLSKPDSNKLEGKYIIAYFFLDCVLDFRFGDDMIILNALLGKDEEEGLLEYKLGERGELYVMRDDERLVDIDERILKNFHIVRGDAFPVKEDIYGRGQPVIAIGNPKKSKLLKRAIKFTDDNLEILPEVLSQISWPKDYSNKIIRGTRILKGKSAASFRNFVLKSDKED